jgi:hypothetical protein
MSINKDDDDDDELLSTFVKKVVNLNKSILWAGMANQLGPWRYLNDLISMFYYLGSSL